MAGGDRDWVAWHEAYAEPASGLAARLRIVQQLIAGAIDARPGVVRVISACAGQGNDLLGVLAGHPRRHDVVGRLVELDPRNAEVARRAAAGLPGIEVVTGDGSTTDAYDGAAPADLLLLCGIFGNISDDDIATTIALAPMLCAPAATVIWTRHRRPPDLMPVIDRWFAAAGFDRLALASPEDHPWVGVGAHRLRAPPQPFREGVRLFTFRDDERG